MDIWRDIIGYNGIYKVSLSGKVKSCGVFMNNKHGGKTYKSGRILKHHTNKKGYNQVKLCLDGVQKSYKVHRLVAESFIENPKNKKQVNHIDGVKDNNNVHNLEWCSNKENIIHAYRNNLINVNEGEKHHNSKLTKKQVKEIREVKHSMKYYSTKYKVSVQTIWKVINNKTYKNI